MNRASHLSDQPRPSTDSKDNGFFYLPALQPDINPSELLKESEIQLHDWIEKPPVCLYMGDESLFYLGDISTTIGKAKGRKTFASGLILAALAGNTTIQGIFRAELPEGKTTVLYFDTEQGAYHAQKAARRVLRLLNTDYLPNFKAYGLRKYPPAERLHIIEHAILNTPELGFVFIDGIRDLITSINDEEQATMITSKLLKWSGELNIHINCVLHMNKGDQNARGHVGTELMNKSLSVLGVNKVEKMESYSTIEAIACRDKEPEPVTFGIDADGLPFVLEPGQMQILNALTETKGKKMILPTNYTLETHSEYLETKIFYKVPDRKYSDLVAAIQNTYQIGENKAKHFLSYLMEQDLIKKVHKGSLSTYQFNKVV
jgi:hypothetical protein